MEFTALKLEHEAAIQDYLSDFARAGETAIPAYFGKPEWSHAETVEKFACWSRGEDLGGWVPSTTQFLVAEGRILGNYNLRHELTEPLLLHGGHCGYSVRPSERRKGYATSMLAHAIELARGMGLERMLVTCEPRNVGSARAVENNGGVLEDVIDHEKLGLQIARYWIAL